MAEHKKFKVKYKNSTKSTKPDLMMHYMKRYVNTATPDSDAISEIANALTNAIESFKNSCIITWAGTTTIAAVVPVTHPMGAMQTGGIISKTIFTVDDILSCTTCSVDDKGVPNKQVAVELFKMIGRKLSANQELFIKNNKINYVANPQSFNFIGIQLSFATAGIHCQYALKNAWSKDDDPEKIDKLKFWSIFDKYLVEAFNNVKAIFPISGPVPIEGPATFVGNGTLSTATVYVGDY